MSRAFGWIALLAGLTVGCSGPGPAAALPFDPPTEIARDQSPVQTDSLSYRLVRGPDEYRAYVVATYRNATPNPVYFARCGLVDSLPMYSIRRSGPDSLRRQFTDWAWGCVGGTPTGVIMPGATASVRVPLGSVDQPNMRPPLKPEDLVGQFRVGMQLCASFVSDSENCAPVPQSARTSNAFIVYY
ncbi:MAG: hypothetical protein ABJE47_21530 [bacterium]